MLETDYLGNQSDKRLYINLRYGLGYTKEIEKPSRNDSKLNVTVEVKAPLTKKMRFRVWGYTNGEYFICCRMAA